MSVNAASNGGSPGLGTAIKQVAEHASNLLRLEIELATLELKQKAAALGVGIALVLGAVVFVVFGFGFLFGTIAAALATFLPTWLALLIVTLLLFALAALLGVIGRSQIRKATPPVPDLAIHEAKVTSAVLRSE